MRRAALLMALAALVPLDGVAAQVVSGNSYACDVRTADGAPVATLSVLLRKTAERPEAASFDAESTPLWVTMRSDADSIPDVEMPTSEAVLRSGRFLVNVKLGAATGIPPIARSVGVRLVLDGDEPVNNGYVVIYRQQAGAHFETVGIGPQAIGLCRMVGNGVSR